LITATPASAPAVERTRWPNGLVICTQHVPGVRSVALGAWVRAASLHETPDVMGVSHLLEHMVFKGTARRSARDLALALESLGGSLDAYTTREYTSYQARVLDRDLDVAADVLHDLLFQPTLREEDLALERGVILEEIAMVDDTPDDLVFELHDKALWGEHPYGYPILGTRETVASIPAELLRARHAALYRPANIVVAAAGNVSHAGILDALARAGWADQPAGEVTIPAVPAPVPAPPQDLRITRDTQQTHVVMGSPTIPLGSPDRPAYSIVNALLGGGMSSRLFQRVREDLGLAYSVYSYQSLHPDVGVHGVYVGTAAKQAAKATQAIRDELSRLVQEGVPEDELALGRRQFAGQYLLSLESVSARMYRAASLELYGEPDRTVDEVLARIDAVTPADALRVAQAWFAPERMTSVTLGPRP
jgi:predicted Zn-dependent peptidase